jgi:hypothetical protein
VGAFNLCKRESNRRKKHKTREEARHAANGSHRVGLPDSAQTR